MSINKKLSFLAISGVLAQFCILPAYAESLPKMEKDQIGNSANPDVDPGASKGTDPSIVTQEKDQMGNSVSPVVDPGASKGKDESIVKQEQDQIPH
jgi:hypothetical protein